MTQEKALSILKTGVNVFLTGEPGSGKTHTINRYISYLRECGVEPAITASTGIAATHIGGMTIHSWSGIGIKQKLSPYDLDKISSTEYVVKRIRNTKILIIDEVSMLPPTTLDSVDAVCREVKQNSQPFGGIQIIFVGDFFQLPPIIKPIHDDLEQLAILDEPSGSFACDSEAWSKAKPIVCYLKEQHRQEDEDFLSVLSAIRANNFEEEHFEKIKKRKIKDGSIPTSAPRLYSHNIDVDRVNDEMLSKLSGEIREFSMSSQGREVLVDIFKKGCMSPDRLFLKIGASVMFTKNNPKEGFVNGTLGTVFGWSTASGNPLIKIHNGKIIEAKEMEWTLEENGKIKVRITQLPLRLAWAITVHKSQGMSLDEAVMDLSNVFEFGQGYVALSRVRSFKGLHLLGWNKRAFEVHPEILEKDAHFRSVSDDAESVFSKIGDVELKKMHEDFISVIGGKKKIKKELVKKVKEAGEKSNFLEEIRKKYPNAYRPWNEEQDKDLKKDFSDGLSIAKISKKHGRKSGAIKMRLIKFGLIEAD